MIRYYIYDPKFRKYYWGDFITRENAEKFVEIKKKYIKSIMSIDPKSKKYDRFDNLYNRLVVKKGFVRIEK